MCGGGGVCVRVGGTVYGITSVYHLSDQRNGIIYRLKCGGGFIEVLCACSLAMTSFCRPQHGKNNNA